MQLVIRRAVYCAAVLVALVTADTAHAKVSFDRGVVRIAAAAKSRRTIWARHKSIVVVLAPGLAKRRSSYRAEDATGELVKAHVRPFANRTEIELVFNQSAEQLLPRLNVTKDGSDLVVSWTPSSLAPRGPTSSVAKAEPAKPLPRALPKLAKLPKVPELNTAAPRSDRQPTAVSEADVGAAFGQPEGTDGAGRGVLFGGIVIVSLCVAAAWLWRKRTKTGLVAAANRIQILCQRSIGPKTKLVVAELMGEVLLLGCSERGVHLLRQYEQDRGAERAIDQWLAAGVEEQHDPPAAVEDPVPDERRSASFLSALRKQMRTEPEPDNEQGELDEKWAEGILSLRRGRRASGSKSHWVG